jgi:hypothetical protein
LAWQFDRSKSAVVINLHGAENMNNSKNKNATAAAELALKTHVLAFDPEIMAEMTDGDRMMREIADSVDLTEAAARFFPVFD